VRDAAKNDYRFSSSWRGLYRVMHSACRHWRSEDHVSDQKASFSQDAAQGRGRLRRTAVARCNDPGRNRARKTDAAPKLRVGFFYIPHGAVMWNTKHGKDMDRWTPSGAGADFKLSPILEPLEKHKHAVTSIANLETRRASPPCTNTTRRLGSAVSSPISKRPVQHVCDDRPDHCRRIGQETALPSMEVCSESETQAVACEAGFGCLYSSTLSYRDAHSPLPMESNPRKVSHSYSVKALQRKSAWP